MTTSQGTSPAENKPRRERKPQEYYDDIKAQIRRGARPAPGVPARGHGAVHLRPDRRPRQVRDRPLRRRASSPREPINDTVEVLFIGGGFSALLTAARLRERGVESIRIVERGADVGGTWYWNRYPGVACDVVAYDYLPLLDEMDYVPSRHYAKGPGDLRPLPGHREEVRPLRAGGVPDHGDLDDVGRGREDVAHQHRPRRHDEGTLRDLRQRHALEAEAVEDQRHGDASRATPSTPRAGTTPTPGQDLANLKDKVVGIIGTGATAVQAIPASAPAAKELYVFQRTPSAIDIRDDWPTDPEWAATLQARLAGQAPPARR